MKNLKKFYVEPAIDVVQIEIEDVVLQSSLQSDILFEAPDLINKENIW